MDDAKFQREAQVLTNALQIAMTLPGSRVMAYNGKIGDVEVIVLGYAQDPTDPMKSVKPLALLMTDELFGIVDVQAVKVGP